MTQYIVRRILISIPLLFGISIITFIIINLAPGDPISAMVNPLEEAVLPSYVLEEMKKSLGLDKPMPVRYVIWLKEAFTGNLGYSYHTKQPVLQMVLGRLPTTISLMVSAHAIGIVLGITLGVISAIRQYSKMDFSLTVAAFFMVSVPEFFFALTGMFIFSVALGWLPTFGMWTAGSETGFNWDLIHHAVLPVLALSLRDIAGYMRYTRASMLDSLSADFVTTARAKGLSERLVLWKHAFRNGLIPIVTIIGLSLPSLIGGALIIETIFAWPGVGDLAYQALVGRDYPLQMAVLLMLAVAILAANLFTDVLYAFVDPRIRHS